MKINIVDKLTVDSKKIKNFIQTCFRSAKLIISTGDYDLLTLPGYVAFCNDEIVGMITYQKYSTYYEIISLNSLKESQGIGSTLLYHLETEARMKNIERFELTTTNANIRSLDFYQKRGYLLVELFVDAVEKAREERPEIPVVAANGIPICDEIKMEKIL